MVVCWKVIVNRRSEKKGPSLAYGFQLSIKSGDASNEEAPLATPKRKDLTQKEWPNEISMLVAMETEDGLKRGIIMVVTKIIDWHVQTKKHVSVEHNQF